MRSTPYRAPLFAGAALAFLAFAPANAASSEQEIIFVDGTGDSAEVKAPASTAYADDRAETDESQAEMNALSDKLADPRTQDGVAHMVENMTGRMLDLPVGKFIGAIERARPGTVKRRFRDNATLADIAGRDVEQLPEQLSEGSRQMMGMMSGFAAAFATMLPEFEKMGRELEKDFQDIKDQRRRRD